MSTKPKIGSPEWTEMRERLDQKAYLVAEHLLGKFESGDMIWDGEIIPDPKGVHYEYRTTCQGHKLLLEVLDTDISRTVNLRFNDADKSVFNVKRLPVLDRLASLLIKTGGDNRSIDRVFDDILGLNLSFVACGGLGEK